MLLTFLLILSLQFKQCFSLQHFSSACFLMFWLHRRCFSHVLHLKSENWLNPNHSPSSCLHSPRVVSHVTCAVCDQKHFFTLQVYFLAFVQVNTVIVYWFWVLSKCRWPTLCTVPKCFLCRHTSSTGAAKKAEINVAISLWTQNFFCLWSFSNLNQVLLVPKLNNKRVYSVVTKWMTVTILRLCLVYLHTIKLNKSP